MPVRDKASGVVLGTVTTLTFTPHCLTYGQVSQDALCFNIKASIIENLTSLSLVLLPTDGSIQTIYSVINHTESLSFVNKQ